MTKARESQLEIAPKGGKNCAIKVVLISNIFRDSRYNSAATCPGTAGVFGLIYVLL